MSDYPVNSTAKVYLDIDGNDCTLYQMVRREPGWAQSRIMQCEAYEKAIQSLTKRLADREAKIDSLMLKYCPDEMTDEQMSNYEKHQAPTEPTKDK